MSTTKPICLFLSLCALLCTLSGLAQTDISNKGIVVNQVTGDVHYIPQRGEIKGSPFLFEDWLPGALIMRSGRVQMEPFIKFEVYGNKFVVIRNDTSYEVGPDVMEVRLYREGKRADTLVFRRGFTGLPRLGTQGFVQVLASGKLNFIKVHRMELDEVKEYNNANKIIRFRSVHEYGISRHGVIEAIRLNKNELIQISNEKRNEVAAFVAQEKLNGKDEKSWAATIAYLNKL
jgi:hypothetical protein